MYVVDMTEKEIDPSALNELVLRSILEDDKRFEVEKVVGETAVIIPSNVVDFTPEVLEEIREEGFKLVGTEKQEDSDSIAFYFEYIE